MLIKIDTPKVVILLYLCVLLLQFNECYARYKFENLINNCIIKCRNIFFLDSTLLYFADVFCLMFAFDKNVLKSF